MTIMQTKFDPANSVSIASKITEARKASGYSFEDLAIACGLTIAELETIEDGRDLDPLRIQRVASALRLPALPI
ncbi:MULTISPECIES: helix-turn-helix domain-containing protein [unclassified Rhizobium]|jgi:transcriptional regulator with XRE-family HTH domain|uniref:helix-turn-helix domain-containing protein n=1 Tax=unclassified Rhizobium TaxID=2613769 RepID=UPI003D2A12C7